MRLRGPKSGTSDTGTRGRGWHSATDEPTARRRKPDELLSSVISETTVAAAVELLRKNPAFELPNGSAWVALLLAAEKIGGLNQRCKGDEAKGSIIELIAADKIATIATAEMLDNDVFAIIPDAGTLEEMSEYSLLTNAPYVWAVLTRDEQDNLQVDIIDTDSPGSYLQAQAVASGQLPLSELVGTAVWARNGGAADPAAAAVPQDAPTTQDTLDEADALDPDFVPELDELAAFEDDDPVFDDDIASVAAGFDDLVAGEAGVDDDVLDESDDDPEARLSFVDPVIDGEVEGNDADDAAADVDSPEAEQAEADPKASEPRVIDATTVRDAVARRYADDGLDLKVDLDEFATTFLESSPVTTIDVPADLTGWLGEQVAAATAQANAELAQLSAQHDASLQALYVKLMSQSIEEVLKRNSLDGEGSRLADAMRVVHQEYESDLAGLDDTVRQQQQSVRDAFEAEVEAEASKAASEARARVRARRGPRLDRELAEINTVVTGSLQERHEAARSKVLEQRRRDVQLYTQMGQTRVFDVVRGRQEEFLSAERDLMKQWTASIAAIVDENRKHEIARVATQADQLAHDDSVERLRREQEAALAQLRSEHETRVAALQTKIDSDQSASQAELRRLEESWKHALELERANTANGAERIAELSSQLSSADESHQRRVVELEAERAASADELAKVTAVHANMTRAVLVLMVVLALLMAVVGGIVGYTMR